MSFPSEFPNVRSLPDWLAYTATILGIITALFTFGRYFFNNRQTIGRLLMHGFKSVWGLPKSISWLITLQLFSYAMKDLAKYSQKNRKALTVLIAAMGPPPGWEPPSKL
jgi:hypothetical protein